MDIIRRNSYWSGNQFFKRPETIVYSFLTYEDGMIELSKINADLKAENEKVMESNIELEKIVKSNHYTFKEKVNDKSVKAVKSVKDEFSKLSIWEFRDMLFRAPMFSEL